MQAPVQRAIRAFYGDWTSRRLAWNYQCSVDGEVSIRVIGGWCLTVFPYDSHSIETARTVLGLVTRSPVILAYVGPDQIMPITSVLSALVGVALMFWN
jgi:hypothetical protein